MENHRGEGKPGARRTETPCGERELEIGLKKRKKKRTRCLTVSPPPPSASGTDSPRDRKVLGIKNTDANEGETKKICKILLGLLGRGGWWWCHFSVNYRRNIGDSVSGDLPWESKFFLVFWIFWWFFSFYEFWEECWAGGNVNFWQMHFENLGFWGSGSLEHMQQIEHLGYTQKQGSGRGQGLEISQFGWIWEYKNRNSP